MSDEPLSKRRLANWEKMKGDLPDLTNEKLMEQLIYEATANAGFIAGNSPWSQRIMGLAADRIAELEAENIAAGNRWDEEVSMLTDRIAELEAKVRRYEAMEPCGGNCDLAWRHR